MEALLNIETGVALAPLTTFGIGGPAEYFVRVRTIEELESAIAFAKERGIASTILGGGSNVLVADKGVNGIVIKNEIPGITYRITGEEVLVSAGAGVSWDELVKDTVMRGYWGLENLSAIPGTVGATPVQNVGAYGVEVGDRIASVAAFDAKEGIMRTYTRDECAFSYRDSIFKREEGAHLIVTEVTYRLTSTPQRTLGYRDLALRFRDTKPSLQAIREAVIDIRSSKFPDWKTIGTAGSFFKNPIIAIETYEELKARYPLLPAFPEGPGTVKIPLGWILEHIVNVKGMRIGNVGTYEGQALVIVNAGNATAHEVLEFAHFIEAKVFDATKMKIEHEVNFIL